MLNFFTKIIDTLEELKIDYMLSGSMAMSIYVVPRATRDFDFVIHLKKSIVMDFVKHFENAYYCDYDSIMDALEHQSMFNIIDFESGYKADFVILKNQEFRKTEFARRIEVNLFNRFINVVTKEDLILSKLIWIQELLSPQQMSDLKVLIDIEYDEAYVNYWVNELNLETYGLFD